MITLYFLGFRGVSDWWTLLIFFFVLCEMKIVWRCYFCNHLIIQLISFPRNCVFLNCSCFAILFICGNHSVVAFADWVSAKLQDLKLGIMPFTNSWLPYKSEKWPSERMVGGREGWDYGNPSTYLHLSGEHCKISQVFLALKINSW